MGFTSLLAITAMMLILGMFFVVSVNINLFTEVVKQDFDYVEYYLEDDVSKAEAEKIIDKIEKYDGIKSTEYRTKEDALRIMNGVRMDISWITWTRIRFQTQY